MKNLLMSVLTMCFMVSAFANPSTNQQALIEHGNALIEEKSEVLEVVLSLKDQIEEHKNSRALNITGAVATGAVLVYAVSGYKKYLTGDSFTGFYRLFFGTIGTVAATGLAYNSYKIVINSSEIAEFEEILDTKIALLEEQLSNTRVLISTLEE